MMIGELLRLSVCTPALLSIVLQYGWRSAKAVDMYAGSAVIDNLVQREKAPFGMPFTSIEIELM